MSLNLIKQNVKSPFQLQRSIVSRDEGGAYETGGYNPNNVYNDGGAAAVITGFGNTVAAGLDSITAADKNKMNEKKSNRLEVRSAKTKSKAKIAEESGDTDKASRMQERDKRVQGKLKDTNKKIEEYKETKNPTLKSDIAPASTKKPISALDGSASSFLYKNRLQSLTDLSSLTGQKKKY